MITEDYASFEIARLLRIRGFDEECDRVYTPQGYMHVQFGNNYMLAAQYCSAPTIQKAKKWLRMNYGLHIGVILTYDNPRKYEAHINHVDNCNDIILCPDEGFSSDEEAIEAGIKYCLENLI